ncbi:hypothetical protein EV368DRAFT_67517 [Lentinula lateritia]|nr:hypothetical protein EV368DRAFT_67517 [Lentinula lateritia]
MSLQSKVKPGIESRSARQTTNAQNYSKSFMIFFKVKLRLNKCSQKREVSFEEGKAGLRKIEHVWSNAVTNTKNPVLSKNGGSMKHNASEADKVNEDLTAAQNLVSSGHPHAGLPTPPQTPTSKAPMSPTCVPCKIPLLRAILSPTSASCNTSGPKETKSPTKPKALTTCKKKDACGTRNCAAQDRESENNQKSEIAQAAVKKTSTWCQQKRAQAQRSEPARTFSTSSEIGPQVVRCLLADEGLALFVVSKPNPVGAELTTGVGVSPAEEGQSTTTSLFSISDIESDQSILVTTAI